MSSSTKSTASIDDLPLEMIRELFKHLCPKDLTACSLVNKRWHSVYAAFKVHTLAVIDNGAHYPNKWCYTDNRIEENQICCSMLIYRLIDRPLVSNLRYLALFVYFDPFDLNKLNHLSQLVHLEIYNRRTFRNKKLSLNLPKLEFLAIFDICGNFPLSLDCAQLSVLRYSGNIKESNPLEVKHSETIRKLDTDIFGPKLSCFQNVECLISREWGMLDRSTLLSLPKLKEFHFHLHKYHSWNFLWAKQRLQVFLDDVQLLRGPDFKFRFAGLQLTREKLEEVNFEAQVEENMFAFARNFRFYLANYRLIEPDEAVKFTNFVDYTYFMRWAHAEMAGKFPSCFLQKFTGIERVLGASVGSGPETNASHFLWFLKSLRSLRSLELASCFDLTQEFYDQLSASTQLLENLEIRIFDELNFKFDFISKLPRLKHLKTEFANISLESMSSLVRSVGKPVKVFICFALRDKSLKEGGDFCTILKGRNKMVWEYNVSRNNETKEKAMDEKPEEFLNFYKRLKTEWLKKVAENSRKRKREEEEENSKEDEEKSKEKKGHNKKKTHKF